MREKKWTPGQWIRRKSGIWDDVIVAPERVCEFEGRSHIEAQANADLFFAAPRLVEALEEVMCWLPYGEGLTPAQRGAKAETFTDALKKAEAALAAAYGEKETE